jgi:hypothetical protein
MSWQSEIDLVSDSSSVPIRPGLGSHHLEPLGICQPALEHHMTAHLNTKAIIHNMNEGATRRRPEITRSTQPDRCCRHPARVHDAREAGDFIGEQPAVVAAIDKEFRHVVLLNEAVVSTLGAPSTANETGRDSQRQADEQAQKQSAMAAADRRPPDIPVGQRHTPIL